MTEPKVMTYNQWLKHHNLDENDFTEVCLDCDGTGRSSCFHCGNDSDCEDCEGEGELNFAKGTYEKQRKKDIEKWREWHLSQQSLTEKA
jgi:hypothetical protein